MEKVPLHRRLMEGCLKARYMPDTEESRQIILDQVAVPNWDRPLGCHDWRRHVTDGVRDVWHELGLVAQLAVYWAASAKADAEEWD